MNDKEFLTSKYHFSQRELFWEKKATFLPCMIKIKQLS